MASWNFEHALLLSVPFMLLQFSAYASPLVYIHAGNLSDKCQHKRYHKANAFTVNDAVRIVVANIGLGNCSHVAVTIYSSQLDPNRCTAFFLDGTAKHAAPMGSAQPHRWVFAPLPLHRGLAFLAC